MATLDRLVVVGLLALAIFWACSFSAFLPKFFTSTALAHRPTSAKKA